MPSSSALLECSSNSTALESRTSPTILYSSPKKFLREVPLARLYTILLISLSYFLLQLAVAHWTHALILQIDSYHMLYNILILCTSVISTKMSNKPSLKNTFGWTRLDVCGAVSGLCFLFALSFSVAVESLQAMFHSHHAKFDWMNKTHVGAVGVVGILGLFVNAAAIIILGGFTHHNKGFLGSHRTGQDIVLSPTARRRGPNSPNTRTNCGGPMDLFIDFLGCAIVIIVVTVFALRLQVFHRPNEHVERTLPFIDPCLTILEIIILGVSLFKFAKEAGLILLLTIPDNINVNALLDELFLKFPEIFDIHEFHIWQLNPARVVATCHVVFYKTEHCWVVQQNVIDFLQMKGISSVTLQPEFLELMAVDESSQTERKQQCFLPCSKADDCSEKKCCLSEKEMKALLEKNSHGHSHTLAHSHNHSSNSQSLKSLKVEQPGPSSGLHRYRTQPGSVPNVSSATSTAPVASSSNKTRTPTLSSKVQARVETNRPTSPMSNDYESSDDEAKQERKPMI